MLAITILPWRVRAQGVPKAVRVGWLTAQQASDLTPHLAAMRYRLSEIGYVEGRNLAIEYRYGDNVRERVPDLAAELVRLGVDLIVAQGAAVFVISQLGLTVPVVYVDRDAESTPLMGSS
jgi:putative ABC transport system substrate-binding protein